MRSHARKPHQKPIHAHLRDAERRLLNAYGTPDGRGLILRRDTAEKEIGLRKAEIKALERLSARGITWARSP